MKITIDSKHESSDDLHDLFSEDAINRVCALLEPVKLEQFRIGWKSDMDQEAKHKATHMYNTICVAKDALKELSKVLKSNG